MGTRPDGHGTGDEHAGEAVAGGGRSAASAETLRLLLTGCVAAAQAADPVTFLRRSIELAAQDERQVRSVLAWVLRRLLEVLHPEGLAADDLRAAVARTSRAALPWFEELDPHLLVGVLIAALGQADTEEGPRVALLRSAQHAVVLIAELLAMSGQELSPHLAAALAEVRRAETVEMP